MQPRFGPSSGKPSTGVLVRVCRLVVLMMPVTLLLLVSLRSPVEGSMVLWLGTLFQGLACGLALYTGSVGREPAGPAVIMLYVIAVSWLLLGAPGRDDWLTHMSQAILLVVPLGFFAVQCLHDSGATTMRRARQLAARLSARRDWPSDLMQCRMLPEVKALREALHVDASPALELLANPQSSVRIAALAALEFRPTWRPGQPEVVLQLARKAPEPEVRAAALYALGNLDDRILIESLAELLRDPSPLVRQSANEALLWNTEQRWHWIRDSLRHALADQNCQEDGPLKLSGNQLTPEAVSDLHCWSNEKGSVSLRAALTLGVYYGQLLAAGSTPELIASIRGYLTDSRTPPLMRLEFARLMYQYRELNAADIRRLMDPTMPAPVRLIGCEALLSQGVNPEAVSTLHDLARLPNREIALATADVVQRRLGIDLGLPQNRTFPPVQSRQAAEVARRVLAWAVQQEVAEAPPCPVADSQPLYRGGSSKVNLS